MTHFYETCTYRKNNSKIFFPVSCFSSLFTFLPLGDASVCSEKMAAPGEKSFCVLEYHTSNSDAIAPEVSWHYALWFFFCWEYVKDRVFFPPLPRYLADLNSLIIAPLKNIDAPMLTRVCGKNLNIVSLCAVSPAVHTANISSCQKKLFQFSCDCETFR